MIVVVAAPGTEVTLDALVEHCRCLGVARHTLPERLEVVDARPRNTVGEVLENELRAEFG